jgi:hypothetical protein
LINAGGSLPSRGKKRPLTKLFGRLRVLFDHLEQAPDFTHAFMLDSAILP